MKIGNKKVCNLGFFRGFENKEKSKILKQKAHKISDTLIHPVDVICNRKKVIFHFCCKSFSVPANKIQNKLIEKNNHFLFFVIS